MIPGPFEYHAPTTLAEAISLLERHADDAKLLSGGQSLIPMLKLRLATPGHLVDLNRVPGLALLAEDDSGLRIGALTREADLEQARPVAARYPILLDTASVIADPLVRNLATVCGNLAHGDPANDHPATMLALDAEVVAVGPRGIRRLPVSAFFTGPYTTRLLPDEILIEIFVPKPPARSGGAYVKLERKVGDYATVAVAVQLSLDASGRCVRAGIGLTNVGPTPIKATRAEEGLAGRRPDADAIAEAARLAAEAARPKTDARGSAEYKRDLVRVLAGRAIARALARAEGGPAVAPRAA
jgi:carbon-monoxide dehydrogenase medium subunit